MCSSDLFGRVLPSARHFLLGVKSGLYVDVHLPVVWVVLLSCVAPVVTRSSDSVSQPLAVVGWG